MTLIHVWRMSDAQQRPFRKEKALARVAREGFESAKAGASDRLQMRVAALEELVVGVAHRLGPPAAEHHLHVDRLEPVVLVAVDHAGRAADRVPRAEPRGDALA